MMHLLLPSDIYDKRVPDPDFAVEAVTAAGLGFTVVLFHLESLREGDLRRALVTTQQSPRPGAPIVYRGWMLSDREYTVLYDALTDERGFRMRTSPAQYTEAHSLPDAYRHIAGVTPESFWTYGEDYDAAWGLYQDWGRPAAIVKDYVKSAKHRWNEACFLPEGCERAHFDSVLGALRTYRGPDFTGGFVVRRFVPLRIRATTTFGQPLHEEYRLFFADGECLVHTPFSEGVGFESGLAGWSSIARRFGSRFLSLDVARTADDGWIIVETGDGGVSGLPEGVSAESFFSALKVSSLWQSAVDETL